jgi:hypothetical protein
LSGNALSSRMKMAMGAAAAAAVVGTGIAIASTRTPPSPYAEDRFRFFLLQDMAFINLEEPLLKSKCKSYYDVLLAYHDSIVPPAMKDYLKLGRDELRRQGYPMGEGKAERYFKSYPDPEHMSNATLDKVKAQWKSKPALYDKMYLLELNLEHSKREV